jgi:hypothetical protein
MWRTSQCRCMCIELRISMISPFVLYRRIDIRPLPSCSLVGACLVCFTAVSIKITGFLTVTPCSLADGSSVNVELPCLSLGQVNTELGTLSEVLISSANRHTYCVEQNTVFILTFRHLASYI